MARPGRFVGLSTGALRQCAMCWSAIRNGTRLIRPLMVVVCIAMAAKLLLT